MKFATKYLFVVSIGLLFWAPTDASLAQALTPAQIVKPADLTAQESAYYQKLTDQEVKKNFIETRSYVRLCQQVLDHRLPAAQLPDKPLGFSVRYLLAGEANVINSAIAESIIAGAKEDRAKR
jgi:hypothetical protein